MAGLANSRDGRWRRPGSNRDATSRARGPWPDWPCRLLACGKAGKGTAKPPVRTCVIVPQRRERFAQMYSIAEKGKRRNAKEPQARRREKVFAVRPQDVLAFFQKAATLKATQSVAPEKPANGAHAPQAIAPGADGKAETSAFWLHCVLFSVMMDLHGIPCGSLPENGRRLAFNQRALLPGGERSAPTEPAGETLNPLCT